MVIDRMSDDAVAAVMVGHEIGNELGLRTLSNEIIFLGVVSRPERCGETLSKYGVKYPLAKRSALKYLEKQGWRPPEVELEKKKEPLPFSNEAKATLTLAAKIADYLLSTSVNSEHVLLALFAYNYGNPIADREVTGAREVLLGTEGVVSSLRVIEDSEGDKVRKKFTAYDLCEEVLRETKRPYNPQDQQSQSTGGPEAEPVLVGGSSGTTNTLDEVGVDLTLMAAEGAFDPVYGRDNEIRMALRTLGRRRKNNPCLIGDPGVGKTAIAEAIAQVLASSYEENTGPLSKIKMPEITVPDLPDVGQGLSKLNPFRNKEKEREEEEAEVARLAQEDELATLEDESSQFVNYTLPPCPRALAGFRLIGIDLASLVAGTRNRGDFEEKVQRLVQEAAAADNVILFVDEIHNLLGTGGEGAMNAANLLKPALARGELRMMGATTSSEYRRYFAKDAALERRFQPLQVKEPTVEETLQILKTVVKNYATYHGVEYTDNSLIAAAKLSDRYVADRFLPDKAIDLIDEAGSMMKMTVVVDNNDQGKSNDDDDDLVEELDYFVTEDDVATVVAELTGIPVGRLDTGEKERLRRLEFDIGARVKGQDQAVREVAKAVRRARSGLSDARRPTCSFMFAGPTGVGKTELTKALAQFYYGGGDKGSEERNMVRIDMSEYMDRFSTTRLIGSPPGYVGYDEGGQLTEAVRRKPHSVVLFDEIEKAHEDVLNVLLQLLDEGQLTDGKGRTVSFKNTIVIMTSNLGSREMQEMAADTSIAEEERAAVQADVVRKALADALKPELRNRIDKFVYFNTLSYENLEEIALNILDGTVARAKEDQDLRLVVGDRLVSAVAREAATVSGEYGARPVRRAAQRYLDDTLSEAIMREFIDPGDEVTVDVLTEEEAKKITKRSLDKDKNNNAPLVKITKVDVTGSQDSMTIPVEMQGDLTSSSRQDLEWQAAYGDLPDIDDDDNDDDDDSDNLKSETEAFQ